MNPWEQAPKVWKNRLAYMTWLRGQVRGIWNSHPIKITFIQSKRYKGNLGRKTKSNPNGMVWCCTCESCRQTFRQSDCEVDHIDGGYGFTTWEEFMDWTKRILWVSFEDLRIVCKECHRIISYSQRMGISFEEALKEKEAIKFSKLKTGAQVEILKAYGKTASNAKLRRQAFRDLLDLHTNLKIGE